MWKEIPDKDSTWLFCAECPVDGKLFFTWFEVIQRRTYGTYAIVVPFSDTNYITPSQVVLLRSRFLDGSLVEFYGIKENYYQLTIRLPAADRTHSDLFWENWRQALVLS